MKAFLKEPEVPEFNSIEEELKKNQKTIVKKPLGKGWKRVNGKYVKVCDHSNSIVGSKGRYCIDCERYV
jgi:hypothetical protein